MRVASAGGWQSPRLRRERGRHEQRARIPVRRVLAHHRVESGLLIPTRRMIYSRDEGNHRIDEPLVVSIDLEDIKVT